MNPDQQIIEYLHIAERATAEEIAVSIGLDSEEVFDRLCRLSDRGKVDHYRSGYPLKWGICDDRPSIFYL